MLGLHLENRKSVHRISMQTLCNISFISQKIRVLKTNNKSSLGNKIYYVNTWIFNLLFALQTSQRVRRVKENAARGRTYSHRVCLQKCNVGYNFPINLAVIWNILFHATCAPLTYKESLSTLLCCPRITMRSLYFLELFMSQKHIYCNNSKYLF